MTAHQLPRPLVPAEVDLTDFQFMSLDVRRLRDSRLSSMVSGEGFRCAVLLWCAAWHQIPAASIPDDDIELSQLAGFGRAVSEWQKVREEALYGWVKCSDGRFYHPVVAEKANEAWTEKLHYRWRKECDRVRKLNRQREKERLDPLPLPPNPTESASDGYALAELSNGNNEHSDGKRDRSEGKPERGHGIPAENALIGTGTGKGTGKDIDLAQQPTGPRGAAAARNPFDELIRVCSEALGDQAPADPVIGPIALLIERGARRDEVLTVLRSEARRPRRKPIRTWQLWAEIIAERLADSVPATPQAPTPATAPEDPNDPLVRVNDHASWPESLCRRIARDFELYGNWLSGIGPEPGQPGCRFPDHVLPERFRTKTEVAA